MLADPSAFVNTAPAPDSGAIGAPSALTARPDPGSNHLQAILDSVSPENRPKVLAGVQVTQEAAAKAKEAIAVAQEHGLKVQQTITTPSALSAAHSSSTFPSQTAGSVWPTRDWRRSARPDPRGSSGAFRSGRQKGASAAQATGVPANVQKGRGRVAPAGEPDHRRRYEQD